VNHPAQPPGQARYLNGNLVSVIETDYGGYVVTLASLQMPPRVPRWSHWLSGRRVSQVADFFPVPVPRTAS
jgi:hypothetical protein